MTKELEKIEARCKAATRGPWFFEGAVGVVATPANEDDADIDDQGHRYVFVFDPKTIGETACMANLEFAAEARQDIPDLIEEVKKLREAAKTFQELSVCHRLRKCPSKTLFARLQKASQILKESNTEEK